MERRVQKEDTEKGEEVVTKEEVKVSLQNYLRNNNKKEYLEEIVQECQTGFSGETMYFV